ncbi:MAG: hypothetical protein AAB289_14960 [Chloroflexota bacterium]
MNFRSRISVLAALLMLLGAAGPMGPGALPQPAGAAATGGFERYIVTLKPGVDPAAVTKRYNARAGHYYRTVFRGFSASLSDAQASGQNPLDELASAIRVSRDQIVRLGLQERLEDAIEGGLAAVMELQGPQELVNAAGFSRRHGTKELRALALVDLVVALPDLPVEET